MQLQKKDIRRFEPASGRYFQSDHCRELNLNRKEAGASILEKIYRALICTSYWPSVKADCSRGKNEEEEKGRKAYPHRFDFESVRPHTDWLTLMSWHCDVIHSDRLW